MLQEVQIQVISGSAACQDAPGLFPYDYSMAEHAFLVGKHFGKQCKQSMGHGFHSVYSVRWRVASPAPSMRAAPLFPGLDLLPFLEQALLGADVRCDAPGGKCQLGSWVIST